MATDSTTFRLAPPRPGNEHPAVDQHAVQFYEQDEFLLEGVSRFVAMGIGDGDRSTVLIGPDGTVTRTWYGVKPDGHAAEVLQALKT